MNFLSAIKIFKKYGIDKIDTKILNRLENDKRPYIQSFIEFNIYQILSYFIYNKLNVNHKFTTIKSGNLIINTNKSEILLNIKDIELLKLNELIYDNFSNSLDESLTSAILDLFDFDMSWIENEIKKVDWSLEITNPLEDYEFLKKKVKDFIII